MAPKIPDNSCSGDALSELKLKQKELLGNNQFKTLQIQSDADKNIIDDHPEDDQ
jgi:hypothetical protein